MKCIISLSVHTVSNPCELHCRAVGYRFFVKLADKVIDGTPCRKNSTDELCVDGMCKVRHRIHEVFILENIVS